MRLRLISSLLIAAFLVTIGLAAAPRLHEQIHHAHADHECAVTMFASGKCDHSAADPFEIHARLLSPSPVVMPRGKRLLVARVESSVLEHAPPVYS